MTDAWGALILAVSLGGQEPPRTVEQIDRVLTVEWRHKQIRPGDGAMVFTGGVTARYGPTTLHADRLTIYQSETRKEGIADGNVHLDDPDGDIRAANIQFDWLNRTGRGSMASVSMEGLFLHVETLELKPDEWVLLGVRAAPNGSKRPIFALSSPRVTYRPGRGGHARKAALSLGGSKIVTLPSYRFGGRRDEEGLRLPSFSYNQGFGLAWRSALGIDDRTRVSGDIRVKEGDRPGAAAAITRSFLPRNEPGTLRAPQSDIGERFASGYFDSVFVRRPSDEQGELRSRRSSLTLGFTANQGPVARKSDDLLTKPFDLVFEEGRDVAGFGLLGTVRYQSLQEDGGPSERRAIVGATALAPPVMLARGLSTHLRADGSGYLGENSFGWGQVQAGLIFNPTRHIRMGAAYVYGSHTGTSTFRLDELFATRTFHGRVDVDFGATKLSFLTKYDFERRKWFDNEIGLSQVLGPIEPFITFREFPRTVTFGVRLRAEQAFDRLRRRFENRTPSQVDDRP